MKDAKIHRIFRETDKKWKAGSRRHCDQFEQRPRFKAITSHLVAAQFEHRVADRKILCFHTSFAMRFTFRQLLQVLSVLAHCPEYGECPSVC